MIQEFSVENFLSFGEKQTISFVASADKTLADELIVQPKLGVRLLRLAMIYGANASGKSNLLKAIRTLWTMLFLSRENEHTGVRLYAPFELLQGQPTRYHIIFWVNGRKYEYQLEHDSRHILYEKMTYTSDKGVQSDMFERRQGRAIVFGSTLGIKAKQRDDLNRETLANHTVLSTLNKKNIDVPAPMREVYDWIKENEDIGQSKKNEEIAQQAENNPQLKRLILELLGRADFHISDFKLIDFSLSQEVVEEINNNRDYSDDLKAHFSKPHKILLFRHKTENADFELINNNESDGTKTYFRLASLLFNLKDNGCVMLKDELGDRLHYDLLLHFLQTYLQAKSKSQLIFTTHNQLLLDEKWMLRRDMVWFAEKERETAYTQLYRASDMKIHKNMSLLNAYRIGKFGAKPVLGSTLINVDEV